jgi:hypothetical protein
LRSRRQEFAADPDIAARPGVPTIASEAVETARESLDPSTVADAKTAVGEAA